MVVCSSQLVVKYPTLKNRLFSVQLLLARVQLEQLLYNYSYLVYS